MGKLLVPNQYYGVLELVAHTQAIQLLTLAVNLHFYHNGILLTFFSFQLSLSHLIELQVQVA